MRKDYDSKIRMFDAVAELYQQLKGAFDVILAFAAIMGFFNDKRAEIKRLQAIAQSNPKLLTKEGEQKKTAMCEAAEAVAKPVAVYANVTGNTVLEGIMSVSLSTLKKQKVDQIATDCQTILDEAKKVEKDMASYNLPPEKLTKLADAIALFKKAAPLSRLAHGEKRTSLEDIDRVIDEADAILEKQLDRLVDTLKDSNLTAVERWAKARKLVNLPSTSTQLELKVLDGDGLPIAGALVSLVNGKTLTAKTNAEGIAQFKPLAFGVYPSLTVSAPGFQSLSLTDIKVKKGKVNKLSVALKAV